MIAAVYARKSTEQNGVSADAKSVTRQIEHAKTYATGRGWRVAEEFVFADDGISGAEFATRPGFMRLLNALKLRAAFQVLIVSELSRLGREQLETGCALKQLSQAGVRVFAYLENREIVLDSATDKFLMSAVSFAAELEREKARQRTFDAMQRKARAGYVTGGVCFGYHNVRVGSHTERVIDDAEAAVVRRIFSLCVAGKGVKTIAKLLNAEGAPAPAPQRGRPRGWASSSVRAVLYRRTYLGQITYGMTRKRDSWGARKYHRRDEREWLRVDQPAWRIISDAEWEGAHCRLDAAAQTYLHQNQGQRWGRPHTGLEARYLLSGLSQCACCGSSMIGHRTTRGAMRSYTYICGGYSHRGPSVCANGLGLPMPAADAAVLEQLKEYVLAPSVVEGAIRDAIAELQPAPEAVAPMRAGLQAELRHVEQEQERLVQAIAATGDVAVLAAAVRDRETKRAQLLRELEALDQERTVQERFDARQVEAALRAKLADWRGLLGRHTPLARQMVAQLLDGRLLWTPKPEVGCYEFSGRTALDKLLVGVIWPDQKIPRVWRALQDSTAIAGRNFEEF
jgi:DNA invertase Pin-like site-specific DNA recombinase